MLCYLRLGCKWGRGLITAAVSSREGGALADEPAQRAACGWELTGSREGETQSADL